MGFRAKLITSYAALILVTLLLGVALFTVVLGQIQTDTTNKAKARLETVIKLVGDRIANVQPGRTPLPEYQSQWQFDANLLDVRILLVDSRGTVEADTDSDPQNNLINKTITGYTPVPRDGQPYSRTVRLHDVQYFYYARSGPDLSLPVAQARPSSRILADTAPPTQIRVTTELWIGVPAANLDGNLNDVLKGFIGAAGLALVISIGLAFLVARSIARPLLRMARASSEIAQGRFSEQLPVKGRDEMARLAQSFNQMAGEVTQSQQTMRDFVANVSHELKTPLTSIQGFSQAIVEGVADDPEMLQHSATVIYEEAARMRRLVDELLDLSRIESGQIELNRRRFDLRGLLAHVVMRLEPLAASKNITLQPRFEDILPVEGDTDRLEQVFTNIVDNAIKYGLAGNPVWIEGRLSAGGESAADAGRPGKTARPAVVQVRIANLGPIIPVDQLPRIFERFYKLDRSRKRRGESTGLGLAIAKELVESHRGTLSVSSRPTETDEAIGLTVFTIVLPLAMGSPETTSATSPAVIGKSER